MRRTAGLRGRARRFVGGEEGGRKGGRREREEIEGYEEEFVEGADCEKNALFIHKNQYSTSRATALCVDEADMYLVGIVKVEQLRPVLVDLLVAHPHSRHRQRSIHMHVMARQI